ncbi:hypothetical protein CBS101457_005897 [Exobasidium rhododendri]|nr:hypothetical protein CBS101457_005897 [Exobasidium rhododendri]
METRSRKQSESQTSVGQSEFSFDDDDDVAGLEEALAAAEGMSVSSRPALVQRTGRPEGEKGELKLSNKRGRDEEEVKEHWEGEERTKAYLEEDAYKPSAFGDFKAYMQKKRLKLKIQESSMTDDEARAAAGSLQPVEIKSLPPLFKGTNIYINGHTNPPYGELRRILHMYGGSLMPYLDQKTPVTHILASNLTAKKRIEFKDYKVVRPEWVTQSVQEGKRLDWRDFRCAEDASGAMKMGALQGRAVAGKQEKRATRSREEDLEEARREAAKGDWRSLAVNDAGALSAFNGSGTGPGALGGVGPWGRGSRQKTLAGWAKKPSHGDVQRADFEVHATGPLKPAEAHNTKEEKAPKRSQSEELWLENLETPPKPASSSDSIRRADDKKEHLPKVDTAEAPVEDLLRDDHAIGNEALSASAIHAAGHLHPKHPYASRHSNITAAQLLASPSWRQRNTATSDDFLAGYFGKSRLHHLSTWKSEMKEMVSQALRDAKKEQGSADLPKGVRRVIMHIDFDAFFVSVGLRKRPDLSERAVVVCHGSSLQESGDQTDGGSTVHSTSEIASCNYIARTFGIKNGMSLGQAKRLCDDVQTIPYDFVGYNDVAIKFYTLLLLHADALEAVSIDEALIDVSLLLDEMRSGKESSSPERNRLRSQYKALMNSQGQSWTEEKQLAEALRDEIREATNCEASIGIGDNVLLARTATRKAKPGGSFHLRLEEFDAFAADLDVDELHGIGWSIRNRCKDTFGTCKIGELKSQSSRARLVVEFGEKQGVTIWDKLHGRERSRLESVKPRQSCGTSINYAIRFETDQEAKEFVLKLCEEVSNRLQAIQMVGRVCSISIMVRSKEAPIEAPKFLGHGICDTLNRSAPFAKPTDEKDAIFSAAWRLLSALRIKADQLRGIGVSCQKLQAKDANTRESGQGTLHFTAPMTTKHGKGEGYQKEELFLAEEGNDEKHDELLQRELEPGPSGVEHRRRSTSPEIAEEGRTHEATIESFDRTPFPPSTQFIIPPASQLDPDVIAALPDKIQAQIRLAQQRKEVSGELLIPAAAAPPPSTARATSAEPAMTSTPKAASINPSTPRKDKKVINPFVAMRAASTTPTKKSLKKVVATAAPTFELPRFSQLDQSVLAELPKDVRDEILREARMAGESSMTTRSVGGEGSSSNSTSTPRKRQQYLDLGLSRVGHESRTPSKLNPRFHSISDIGKAAKSGVAAASAGATTTSVIAEHLLEPRLVSEKDLIRLEIDPEFFAALPEEVQRETLKEQAAYVSDKQARFKSGKHIQELSLVEERRLQTQLAYPLEGRHNTFMATPICTSELYVASLPSLKGKTTLEEIRNLLGIWYLQFQSTGPRQKDVDRFAKFLLECAESSDLDQLIKVRGVLKWWKELMDREAVEETSRKQWTIAFEEVKGHVNERVRANFGADVSLK